MNSDSRFFSEPSTGPAGVFFIRLAVGLIFLTQGILKFIDPTLGVNRFTRIGFPTLISPRISSADSKLFVASWSSSGCGLVPLPFRC